MVKLSGPGKQPFLPFSMKIKQKCVNHKIIDHAISDYILGKWIVFTNNVNFHDSVNSKKTKDCAFPILGITYNKFNKTLFLRIKGIFKRKCGVSSMYSYRASTLCIIYLFKTLTNVAF